KGTPAMSTPSAHATSTGVAVTSSVPTGARPSPLRTVLRWELRRLLANRSTKVMVVLLVVVYFLLLGFSLQHDTVPIAANVLSSGGSSNQQMLYFNMSRN